MQKHLLLAALLAGIANLFWAANAIVGKVIVASLPAFTLSQFRWWLALCILIPFGLPRIRRQWPWYRQRLPALLILALLSVTLYNTLQYWALEYTEPVKVGAMLALMPLAIAVVSGFAGGRRQSGLEWLTSAIAVVGALIVISDGQILLLTQSGDAGWGELLMLSAIGSWAFYSVRLKRIHAQNIDAIGLLTFMVALGSLMILPFWGSDIARGQQWYPTGQLWWSVAFLAVFPSIVSYLCWNSAIRLADANIAGIMVTTAPMFNAILSMVFLDAEVSAMQWLGIAVVSGGVATTLLISRWKVSHEGSE